MHQTIDVIACTSCSSGYANLSQNQVQHMTVRLRIAGIYYDETFPFDQLKPIPAFDIPGRSAPAGPTIFELLEAAYRKPGENKDHFIYVFERRNRTLSITSLGVTHTTDIGLSLGEKRRNKGPYQLTETAIPFGVVAWQYYVYRGGISASQQKPNAVPMTGYSGAKGDGSGFTGFDQFVLKDGDEVIYRQVAILREPNGPVKYGAIAAEVKQ